MRIIAIDFGNSSTKMALYENVTMVSGVVRLSGDSDEEVSGVLQMVREWSKDDVVSLWYSSVVTRSEKIVGALKQEFGEVRDVRSHCPFRIEYATPETLGMDRIAAVAGAIQKFGLDENYLVIDVGTAITYDVYRASDRTYCGGNIAPGVSMRLRALHEYTSRLPLVEVQASVECEKIQMGKSTEEALLQGVLQGVRLEIQGYIEELRRQFDERLVVILTGNDNKYFKISRNCRTFVLPNLVLDGVVSIALSNRL